MTEGRNTGFKKILDALEANGSPKPEFETDEDHSYFISRLFVHEDFLKEVLKEADYRKIVAIAEVIDKCGSITPAEAKEICGKSETTWRYLNILTDTGYVVFEGSTNNTVYRRSVKEKL